MSTTTNPIIDTTISTDIQVYCNQINLVNESLCRVIKGQDDLVFGLICGLLTRRAIALTGVPGIAKSLGAKALAHTIGFGNEFARIQCTPDMLPSDFGGYVWFNQANGQHEFRPGPLFRRVVLLDELNRASGRSLSGIMEGIEEGTVSVDGTTYGLPAQRVVIATWNPLEHAGTEMLPDAIRDRFDLCIYLGYPEATDEAIIAVGGHDSPEDLFPVISAAQIIDLQLYTDGIWRRTPAKVAEYVVELVAKTRTNEAFSIGGSPRASKALLRIAACKALLRGSNAAVIDDVRAVAGCVLRHRLEPNFDIFDPTKETRDAFIERSIEELVK